MSDINLDFTVSSSNINVVVEPNDITFTPTDISLNIFTGSPPTGGLSSDTELLFNNNNLIDGIPTATFANGNLSLGNVANLKIAGGVNGYFLQTDGTGNLDWAAGGGGGNGSPGGSNTQIQYNDNGVFGGNAGFTFNEVSGNVNVPKLIVAGNISTTNDVLAGNAGITGSLSAGTLSAGNLNITGNTLTQNMTSNANVIGVNFTANGNIGVSGNANITGNVSANNATFSNLTLNSNVVHLGADAGSNSGPFSIAVGAGAGNNNQGFGAIAIGVGAGVAGNGQYSIAIGADAGLGVQGNSAIAIGTGAGLIGQSDYVIAIGANSGYDGPLNAQANNTIVLNATGANLIGNAFANAFYVKPIRSANTANVMYYNPTTGELTYNPLSTIAVGTANTVINNAQPNITSVGILSSLSVTGNALLTTLTVTGNANVGNIAGTNIIATTLSGNISTASQPNISAVGTLTGLNVSSSLRAVQFISNVTTGTQPIIVASTTRVANLNVATAGVAENLSNANANLTVNSVSANSSVVPIANATGSLGFTAQRWANIFVGNVFGNSGNLTSNNINFISAISSNLTPNAATSTTVTHKIPITLNGVVYYMCLTNTP